MVKANGNLQKKKLESKVRLRETETKKKGHTSWNW